MIDSLTVLLKKLKWMRAVGKTNEERQRRALTGSVSEEESKTGHQTASGRQPSQLLAAKVFPVISDMLFLSKYGSKASSDWL